MGNSFTVTTLPDSPHIADPTGVSGTGFTANWAAPDGGSALSVKYTIQLASDRGFVSIISTTPNISGTSNPFTGLVGTTQYYYRVEAVTTAGTSVWSRVDSINNACSTPNYNPPRQLLP
ncbi:MAG: fibronectin type III domain-containing protein [Ferruginibacter sp.]